MPQLSANLSVGQTSVASFSASSSYSYGISASIDLFNPSDFYSLKSAYAEYEFNLANYGLTEAGVFYDIRSAFIDLLIAQARVDLQKKILARRQENSRMIELRYNSGVEDKGNLLSTRADESSAKYNLSSAERDLRLAKLNLSQLLGSSVDKAEGETALPKPAQPDFEALISASPAYLSAKYQLESADIQQQSTLSEFLPSVTLSGSYRKSGGSWPPGTDSNSLSLGVSYSLFPGGANFIDETINSLKLDKAREDFDKAVKDTRFSVVNAFEGINDALEALDVSKVLLEAATERSNIAQAKYINGLLTYDEWDIIENSYISTQSSLLNAEKNALTADAAWQKSYGGYVK